MPPTTLITLLLTLTCLLDPTRSLSSQSPQDLLAYPKYTVSLADWSSAMVNSTATAILSSRPEPDAEDDGLSVLNTPQDVPPETERPVYRQRLMRTATGQGFLCAVPPLPELKPLVKKAFGSSSELVLNDEEQRQQKAALEKDGLKKGLELLESLKDRCIYTRLGWFTYSFCYGQGEIRQFHAVMIPGHNHPHEDPDQDVYILGLHLSHPQNPHHQARVEGALQAQGTSSESSASGELTTLGRNRFSSSTSPVIALSDVMQDETGPTNEIWYQDEEELGQKRYLVQRWEGGTTCDLTGKARSVEVQFHCSTVGSDHIALLRETSICEYLLIIHTPRLCSEPLFLDGGVRKAGVGGTSDDGGKIECKPILSEEEIERWNVSEVERQRKEEELKQKAIDDALRAATTASPAIDESQATPPGPAESDAPPPPHEQTVLGTDSATSDDKSSSPSGGQTAEGSKEKPTTMVMDPITVFFDTDTGKIYMDEAAPKPDARAPEPNPSEPGTVAPDEPARADHQARDPATPPSLEELTKALRESLGAVLRDLREEGGGAAAGQGGRQGQQAQPQPLSELIAALKESGGTIKSRKTRPGSKKEKSKKQTKNKKIKQHDKKVKNPGMAGDSDHQKLLNMYQNKFEVVENDEKKEENKS